MHRLLRRSRSADLDAAANIPPLAPLAAVPPAPAAPGAGLLPRAPAAAAVPAAVPAAPAAAPLPHGVGRDLVPASPAVAPPPSGVGYDLDAFGALAPAQVPADGLPHTITHFLWFKLDLAAGNYSKWRHLFYCILCKYNAQQHVEQDRDPLHEDVVWRNDDITIVLWISSTISNELYDVVVSPPNIPTAYQIWQTLRLFFLDNQAGRTIHLSAEFRSMVQGDLPVVEYARRLQSLAAALADVEEPVTDRTLTLQFIHGLSRRFHVLATVLPLQDPFPNFAQGRSRLLLEEITQNERARADGRSDGATALSLTNTSDGSSGSPRAARPATPPTDKGKAPADPSSGGDRGHGRWRDVAAAAGLLAQAPTLPRDATPPSSRSVPIPGWGTLRPTGARSRLRSHLARRGRLPTPPTS
ncbi:hypothetical protein D1007_14620 [Hordeum vulgare]|nr:hypothetical protein D1007_14620 [Hordeum vulgare]